MSSEQPFTDQIKSFFEQTFDQFGPTPKGMDWNSEQAQEARFEQLLKVCGSSREFSIIDYGCGYGALAGVLAKKNLAFQYWGYDLSEVIIAGAQELYRNQPNIQFTARESDLPVSDFTVACGIFNKKFEASDEDWTGYVLQNLDNMAALSRKGFSFNLLTQYSDPERMRPDLYYADPCFFFDHCKQRYARNVALLHDYDYYDFTIIIREPFHS
jgi:hypothetical protein